ncbi:LysR family transcriptional regulator [Massilia sp. DWR3-1-1]|uniref:LysR family transcriptional regulator n=1 Tax=Massilia sp. DWR3-1-1 TaxID=2804559 RepID=UPI003CF7801B
MSAARDVLTPATLAMLQAIADCGSFAGAARASNMVPSALTYRVRVIEEALDVLLFDRSARQARLTEAGKELLREGARLLADIDAVANRVKRVATGWEAQLTIAVDSVIDRLPLMELCEAFFAMHPPTRLRLRTETLSGTLAALTSGQADLAIGVVLDSKLPAGLEHRPLGSVPFVFAVAPQHRLAAAAEPLSDAVIGQHRAVALADSVERGGGLTVAVLPGQDVFTVADMRAKIDAQVRGLGVGFLPAAYAGPYIANGSLVRKELERPAHALQFCTAWTKAPARSSQGRALAWWLARIDNAVTRAALLGESGHRLLP